MILSEFPRRDAPPEVDEIAALQALAAGGVPVTRIAVVPAEVEERFYRLNNLPARISALFADVDPRDPDEDDLEERAPAAMELVERHFLLDELVDAFYDRIAGLPARVRVRRPGAAGVECARGRPALLAVKRLWAGDWSFDALVGRLERTGTFAIEERPVLVHGRDEAAAPLASARARAVLGEGFEIWTTPTGETTRASHRRKTG